MPNPSPPLSAMREGAEEGGAESALLAYYEHGDPIELSYVSENDETKKSFPGMRTINIALVACLAITVILTIVATAIPFASMSNDQYSNKLSLWQQTLEVGGSTHNTKVTDLTCMPIVHRLQAGGAMAILAIFAGVAATALFALLSFGKHVVGLGIALINSLQVAAFLCMLAWILEANVYSTQFESEGCPAQAMSKGELKLSGGFALFFICSLAYPALAGAFWFFNRKAEGFAPLI